MENILKDIFDFLAKVGVNAGMNIFLTWLIVKILEGEDIIEISWPSFGKKKHKDSDHHQD